MGTEQIKLLRFYLQSGFSTNESDETHLEAAVNWLCRAQDVCEGNGVSSVYSFKSGWGVAYPETSGYIIATFLAYADVSNKEEYVNRAIQLADWEIAIQAPSGGVLSNPLYSYTRVFNTGQVILGWCALYEKTREKKYLEAASRAGEYLLRIQDPDGCWQQDTYCGARTYHARVDWSLLRLTSLTGEKRFSASAIKNLRWVLKQQQVNGWFTNCGFNNDFPIMHVIIYTLRGLLESHLIDTAATGHLNIIDAVSRAADALCDAAERYTVNSTPWMISTSFDADWKSRDAHSCLTGNAQFACFLFRLAATTGNSRYRTVAERVLQVTERTQLLNTTFAEVNGALPGCYPLYHGYHPNSYPNWATKFLADAIMMKIGFEEGKTVLG